MDGGGGIDNMCSIVIVKRMDKKAREIDSIMQNRLSTADKKWMESVERKLKKMKKEEKANEKIRGLCV